MSLDKVAMGRSRKHDELESKEEPDWHGNVNGGRLGDRPLREKRQVTAPVEWDLRLYVAGPTAKSARGFSQSRALCEEHLAGRYHIEVIDLMKILQLAEGDQILALPTLVRKLPSPIRKIIGDMSNTERVLVGLDLRARDIRIRSTLGKE